MDNQMNPNFEDHLKDEIMSESEEWHRDTQLPLGPIMPPDVDDDDNLSLEEIKNLLRLDDVLLRKFMACKNVTLMRGMLDVNERISADIFKRAGINSSVGVITVRQMYNDMIRLKRVLLCNLNHPKVVNIIMQCGGPGGERGDLQYACNHAYQQELEYLSMPLWMQTKYHDRREEMNLFLFLEN